ncbi:hypothetical protein C8F01DRAFT_1092614 [Mycena amicta]|nr:hypothetical protein C8F01DRAFT_1092614 [Mycena amicta]
MPNPPCSATFGYLKIPYPLARFRITFFRKLAGVNFALDLFSCLLNLIRSPDDSKVLAESSPDESDDQTAKKVVPAGFTRSTNRRSLSPRSALYPLAREKKIARCTRNDTASSTSFLVISAADIPEDIPALNPFEQEGGKHGALPRGGGYEEANTEKLVFVVGVANASRLSVSRTPGAAILPVWSTTVVFGAAMGGFGTVSADGGSEESDDELAGDGSGNGETNAVVPMSAVPPAGFLFGIPQTNFFGRLDASVFAVQSAGQNGDQDHLNVDADGDDEQTKHVDGRGEIPAVEEDENHHDAAAPAMCVEGEEEVEGEALDMFAGTKTVKRAAPKQLSSPKKKALSSRRKLPDVNEDDAEFSNVQLPEATLLRKLRVVRFLGERKICP